MCNSKTKICRICKDEKTYDLLVPSGKSKKDNSQLVKNVCKKCWNKRREEQRKLRPTESRRLARQRHELTKRAYRYGLTTEAYYSLLEDQDNKCAICNRDQKEFNKMFAIDHDHISGNVRGLLCQNCNTALGQLKENTEVFKSAITYLEKSKQEP